MKNKAFFSEKLLDYQVKNLGLVPGELDVDAFEAAVLARLKKTQGE